MTNPNLQSSTGDEQRGLFRSSFLVFVTQIALFFLSFPLSILIARALQPAARGEYTLILLVPAILGLFLDPGLGNAGVYHVGQRSFPVPQIAGMLFTVSVAVGVLGILIWGIVAAAAPSLTARVLNGRSGMDNLLWLSVLALPSLLLYNYFTALLLAVKRVVAFNACRSLITVIQLVVVTALVLVGRLNLSLAVVSYTIAIILASGVTLWTVSRTLKFKPTLRWTTTDVKMLKLTFRFGMKGYLGRILPFLGYRLDVFLLAALMSTTEVGIYAIGVALAERIWTISSSVSTILFPRIAASTGNAAVETTTEAVRHTLLVISLAALGLAALAHPLIVVLYGQDYVRAADALVALLPGVVAVSIGSVLSSYITGRGRPELGIVPAVASIVVNVLANVMLIPKFGIVGAALASTLSYTLSTAILAYSFLVMSSTRLSDLVIIRQSDLARYRTLARQTYQKLGHRFVRP